MLKGYTIIEDVEKWLPPASTHSCARLIMLRYTRCNIVILMVASAWLMLSFSSCIVCGFDSYTVLFKCSQRTFSLGTLQKFSLGTLIKYGMRIKSTHDTGNERQHQPHSCSHENHCVISGIPQHCDSTTVE